MAAVTEVDDAAEGIVLEAQECHATVHFGRLTAAFLKTLEAEGIDHIAAIALTQQWMKNERVEDEE